MLSANLTNETRKSIYRRDGYRCALCDSTRFLQIHHVVPCGKGGTNSPHNLICLCSDFHALAHGTNLRDWQDVTQEDIEQACCEYLADYYAPAWNPWAANPRPCECCPSRKRFGKGLASCCWARGDSDEDCPYDIPPP